jgi:2-polyprenyl-3-methyl-5-hydroxy-6-metoxy-1,4-benzoquinol methylase
MYDPATYWENRLSQNFNFRGVGHQSYSLAYNRWLYRRKRRVLEQVFADVALNGKQVLDVGCGTGFFLDWYRSQGALVDGVDISATAIEALREQFPEAFLARMDFSSPDIHLPRQYDIVNAWDVVYHQTDDESFERFLANCALACKSGGYLICTDGFHLPEPKFAAEHVRYRNLTAYAPTMRNLGFKLSREIPLYRYLNRPAGNRWMRRLQNVTAPLWYRLDQLQSVPAKKNLSVGIWIKK